jgi:2-polyprenyl-3-methyl-5-hydroxy-6-metoxy-1,4-benzoquinol methylase
MVNRLQQQEKVNTYFQSRSSFWKEIYASDGVLAETLRDRHAAVLDWIESLALAPGSQVLEVGCGAGLLSLALAQGGLRVQAIDVVEEMVEQARRQAAEAGLAERLSLEVGDVYALGFEKESFDLVIAVGVIPWLEEPQLAVQEMARVTRPGGHVILTADNRVRLNCLLDPWLNPALAPLKPRVKHALERLGLRRRSSDQPLSMTYHTCRLIDEVLASAKLIKTKDMTRGFELSFRYHRFLPEPLGIALHQWLQHLADRNVPGLRSLGMAYFVLTRKSASPFEVSPR